MAKKIKIDTELVFTSPNIKPVIASIKKQLNGITGTVDIKFKPNITNNFQRINNELRLLRKNLQNVEHQANTTAVSLQKVSQAIGRIGVGLSRQNQAIVNYNKTLTSTKSTAQVAGNAIEDFGKKSALAIKRYAAFTVATTGIIGFSVAAKRAFTDAVQFEREFIKISQVTGKSVGQLRDLSGEIDRLSTGLGVSSKGLVNTAQVLAQAGLTAKDTKIALEALAKTELSPTFGRIEDTTEGAIAAMQQFGIQAKDLDKTLSSLNAVAGAFAVESEDIISVIQKAGGAFKATGGSLNELVALFTSVRQTTRESADQIATGLRTIFTRLERRQTIDFLKTLGVNLTDAQGNFIGVYKSIGLLSEALSKIGQNDPRLTQIFEELGGYRQISRVVPLIQQFTVAERALGIAQRGQNTLTQDASTAQQTLAVQVGKVQEEFKSLFRVIANDSSVRQIITLTLELAKSLNQVTKSLAPILPLITALGAAKLASVGGQYGKAFLGGFGLKRASGGPVPGSGSGDTVPAMLTPGEYVLSKKAVSKIGMSSLDNLNRGVQKFAAGGLVGKVGPGTAIGAGLLLAPLLTNQLGEFGKEVSKVTNILGLLAIGAISLGVKFNTITKLFEKPANIRKGLQGRGINEEAFANIQNSSKYIKPFSGQQKSDLRNNIVQQLYKGLPPGLQPHPQQVDDETNKVLRKLTVARRSINNDLFKQERERLLKERTNQINSANASKLGGIAGIGIGIAGGVFSNIGANKIAKGDKSGVSLSAFGGALSGAGVGAGLGASFGPLGFAIGGVVGGLAGLAQSAKEASDQLERIKSQESFDNLADAIGRVLNGKSTTSSQTSAILAGFNKLDAELSTSTGESRDLTVSNIKGAAASLENLVLKLTSESKSFEQFQNSNGGLGRRSLSVLSLSSNTPLKDLEAEVKKNIELNKNAEQAQERLNKATFNSANEVEKFVRFAKSVNDASLATDKLVNEFSLLDDVIGGGLGGGKFLGAGTGAAGVLQATGNNDLASTASKLQNVIDTLPNILVDLRGDNPLEEKVLNNFADKLKDIPAFIRDQILSQAENVNGGEAGFLKEIDRNVFDLAKKLTDGFDPIFDSLKSIEDTFKSRVDDLDTQFSKLSENELKLVEGRINVEKIAFAKTQFLASVQNRDVTQGEFNAFQGAKKNTLLQGTVFGGDATAKDLADGLIELQKQIAEQNKIRQNAPRDQVFGETSFLNKLVLESNKLTKALESMAHSTEAVDFAQQKLSKEQEKRQLKFGFAKDFVFGSQEQQIGINRDIRSAQIAAQFGTVKNFSAENKSGALGVLEKIGNTKLASFGGESGTDIIKRIVGNDLRSSNVPEDIIKAITESTTEEQKLISEIQSLIDSQKTAQEELNRVLQTGNEDLASKLEGIFNKFISDQEKLLKENIAGGLNRRATTIQNSLNLRKEQQQSIANLSQFGGIDQAKSIAGILPRINRFKELNNQNQALGTSFNRFDKLSSSIGTSRLSTSEQQKMLGQIFSDFKSSFGDLFSPDEKDKVQKDLNTLVGGILSKTTASDLTLGSRAIVSEAVSKKFKSNTLEASGGINDEGIDVTGIKQEVESTLGNAKAFNDALNLSVESINKLNTNLRILQEVESPEKLANTIKSLEAELSSLKDQLKNVQGKAGGGRIFSPRGTDTVPAMLTPGEFVVNRKAAQANLPLLQDINNGTDYYAGGGSVSERRQRILEARQRRVNARFAAMGKNAPDASPVGFRGTVAERRQFQLLQRQGRIQQNRNRKLIDGNLNNMLIDAGIIPNNGLPANARITGRQDRADFLQNPDINITGRQNRKDFLRNPTSAVTGRQSRKELLAKARANRGGGLAMGGVVGYANGGAVSGGGGFDNGFNESVNKFLTASSQLVEAMNKFPHTISMETTGRIEVVHNGLEMFQQMQPAMANYVDGKIKDAINKLMKGPLQGASPR